MENWRQRQVDLKFYLGEFTLWKWRFPALVLDLHFSKMTEDPLVPAPPFEKLSYGLEALIIRSHPVSKKLLRFSLLPQAIRYVPSQYIHYYVSFKGSFQDYLKKFSSKTRNTLLRKIRKYSDLCKEAVIWREFRDEDEILEFYSLARKISQKTYQEKLLSMGLPTSEDFQNKMIELAKKISVRGYILFYFEKPIAYIFCSVEEDILLYQYVGYEPEFNHFSPGTILQYLVLEKLFKEKRFNMFDFTEGQGQHKQFFATHGILCANIFYFRWSFKNIFILTIHSAIAIFSFSIVRILDTIRLKNIVKKYVRGHS